MIFLVLNFKCITDFFEYGVIFPDSSKFLLLFPYLQTKFNEKPKCLFSRWAAT